MPRLVIDGAEYANNDEIVAIYGSEAGSILATVNKTPAGLLTYALYERVEDIYYGNRWEPLVNPGSLFASIKDAESHIALALERLNTRIRNRLPDQYVDFWIRDS